LKKKRRAGALCCGGRRVAARLTLTALTLTSRSNSANNSDIRYYSYYCSAGWRMPE
jgi:hypothetical protein